MMPSASRVVRLAELADRAAALAQAEAIFWASATTRGFAGGAARIAFRQLWFGRYLDHAPGEFFIACGPEGDVRGYLAGAFVSDAPPFPGPDYFALFPAELLARYPAHLHINVRADCRGKGIGADLMAAFLASAWMHNMPGAHAVTVEHSAAAAFFAKSRLAPRAYATWGGRDLVFLGAERPAER